MKDLSARSAPTSLVAKIELKLLYSKESNTYSKFFFLIMQDLPPNDFPLCQILYYSHIVSQYNTILAISKTYN